MKFQRAMLGIGKIYLARDEDHMYVWLAGGRVGCELTLALMWPWLGRVKREQALAALDVVGHQYADGGRLRRPPRDIPALIPHSNRRGDRYAAYAWAAGFLDAEGCFGNPRRYTRKDGTTGVRVRVSATQHGAANTPAAVLVQLRGLLGGRIERHGEIDDFKWVSEGIMHVDWVLEELRPWLGPVKVAQGERALEIAEQSRTRGDSDHCVRGHPYDRVYVAPDGRIHRRCNSCARLRDREKRIERGGSARAIRNPPSNATRKYRVN